MLTPSVRNSSILLAAAVVLTTSLVIGAAGIASAAEDEFLDRFIGLWKGGGTAQRSLDSTPRDVSCSVEGARDGYTVAVTGACTALLVLTREVSVRISYDPNSGMYSGTYIGSRVGPAQVSGERRDDTLDLTLTWPREVNGDRTAQMTIHNSGDGQLRIVVSDRPAGTGEPVTTTDLTFTRQ